MENSTSSFKFPAPVRSVNIPLGKAIHIANSTISGMGNYTLILIGEITKLHGKQCRLERSEELVIISHATKIV